MLHGLNFDMVAAVAAIPTIEELNIGHCDGEAIFGGLVFRRTKRM